MNSTVAENVNLGHLRGNLFRIGWQRGTFSDVKISAFGHEYSTHRIILSQSPYFETMLKGDWSDSNSKTVTLNFDDPHIHPDTFRRALEFLYGHMMPINQETVHGTLAIGCFLGLEPLCEQCLSFVAENLTLECFESIYLFCSRFDYGIYSRKMKDLCLDFLRMHACWEARAIIKDLNYHDLKQLLMDDALWVPTEVERFLMLRDAIPLEHHHHHDQESPMSCHTNIDQDFHSIEDGLESSTFAEILSTIRFEHFPETTLNLLREEEGQHLDLVERAIDDGINVQNALRKRLSSSSMSSFGSKLLSRHFRVFSKSDLNIKPNEIANRSFRVGIEFMDLADVYKTKGLGSREYFYVGSLWRVHIVQRRPHIDGNDYISIFIHRRCANGMKWTDPRECIEATLRLRVGWGENKVDRTCQGQLNPDSWHSYGWPQFIRKINFEKCKQMDGSLRLTLNITSQL